MSDEFKFIKCAKIRPERQGPGQGRKILIDASGSHEFSKFVSLDIARSGKEGDYCYYLFHRTADGRGTDTLHDTLEEAFNRAEKEYGVSRKDWEDIL